MKKILYHTLSLLFASFFFASCEKESFQVTFEQGEGVTLRLRLSNNDLQSRAEGDRNDNEYNENAIKKVDLYLYPAGGQGQALKKVSKNIDTTNEVELVTSLSNDEKESLFGKNGTTCRAYALVNYMEKAPDANTVGSTIAALKALVITADFTTTQTSFVMDGESNVTYTEANREVAGTINVNRAASKISLFITSVEKTVTDAAGNIWEPDYEEMAITFHNGVNKATVDVGYTEATETTPARPNNTYAVGENIYETSGIRDITATCTNASITTDATYNLTTSHDPFYSYSYDWANAANDDKNPIITILVPWRKISEKDSNGNIVIIPENDRASKTSWQTCYYQIPVNAESKNGSLADCFERNMYYQIKLHVGILGDFNPATATTIPASYYTVDWKNQDVDVDIKNYKYLVVDKNDVTVYNENTASVPYISSDAVSVQILSITRPNYKNISATTENIYTYKSGNPLTSTNGFTLTAENGILMLQHTLDNNINSSTFDYVPYTVKVKIYHTSASTKFVEEVEFVQYPAVYVVNSLNEGTTDTWNNNNNLNNNNYTRASGFGYVMVNTLYANRYDYDYNGTNNQNIWQTVEGFDGSSNNPNMYIVTTTALDSSLDYLLGDSREPNEYTDTQMDFTSISDVNNKKLVKYRPTKTDREDYLSPKFRISSAYGQLGSNTMSLANAKKRCAAYQEYGYPAGRWRLATTAELRYIATLCAKGALPISLFGGSYYWSATHAYSISTTNGTVSESTSNIAYLRCVYDDWYWGSNSLKDKTKYTWGDEHTTEQLNAMSSQQE